MTWQQAFLDGGQALDLPVDERLLAPLGRYLDLLLEWNARLNLTAITDPEEIAVKHFLDSLTVLRVVPVTAQSKVLDVGAGAGFPGIPLALATGAAVDLLDSLGKRCRFLEVVSQELGLRGRVICRRAEDYARGEGRDRYDLVLARAVAPLPSLVEYCLPLVAVGGVMVAMQGPRQEVGEAAFAARELGGTVQQVAHLDLPGGAGERTLVVIRKDRPTPPRYPRGAAAIAKRPLRAIGSPSPPRGLG